MPSVNELKPMFIRLNSIMGSGRVRAGMILNEYASASLAAAMMRGLLLQRPGDQAVQVQRLFLCIQ